MAQPERGGQGQRVPIWEMPYDSNEEAEADFAKGRARLQLARKMGLINFKLLTEDLYPESAVALHRNDELLLTIEAGIVLHHIDRAKRHLNLSPYDPEQEEIVMSNTIADARELGIPEDNVRAWIADRIHRLRAIQENMRRDFSVSGPEA